MPREVCPRCGERMAWKQRSAGANVRCELCDNTGAHPPSTPDQLSESTPRRLDDTDLAVAMFKVLSEQHRLRRQKTLVIVARFGGAIAVVIVAGIVIAFLRGWEEASTIPGWVAAVAALVILLTVRIVNSLLLDGPGS